MENVTNSPSSPAKMVPVGLVKHAMWATLELYQKSLDDFSWHKAAPSVPDFDLKETSRFITSRRTTTSYSFVVAEYGNETMR